MKHTVNNTQKGMGKKTRIFQTGMIAFKNFISEIKKSW